MRKLPACVAVAGVARTQTKNNRDLYESAAVGTPARRRPVISALILFAAIFPLSVLAQEQPAWEVQALNQIIPGLNVVGVVTLTSTNAVGTNGVFVQYKDTTLTADSATVDWETGEAVADGHVRIEMGDQIWLGEHINYNFKTHQMRSEQFRTGKPPVFAAGENLQGDISNKVYSAQHVFVTSDDVSDPSVRIRASRVRMVPGQYIEAWNAVLFMNGVPAFYFPYYKRSLGVHANELNFMPGFRSAYGPYLLTTYTWWLNDAVDGVLHADYRERRGLGVGPDLNLHLGRWGDGEFKYYYLHDLDSNESLVTNSFQNLSGPIPKNRQRFYFGWQATPATNLNVKALVNYQSDPLVLHDFFEGDYTANPQPNTFVEVNKYWRNWSLDAETTPRVNNFFDQVERLPEVKLTGFRQEVVNTPVFYESESSAGYYRRMLANTNALFGGLTGPMADVSAPRADTHQQLLVPKTFFGWLNITPRAGGRFTYYGPETGPGGTNSETYRKIFNTGVDVSAKSSRLWTGATNSLLDMDGLRHIVEPSVSYAFVPRPSTLPAQLPQFDSALPSPLLLPIQLPDYNNIDSIDSENVIRFGLRNTLQTKRAGELQNLLDWNVLLDWRLHPTAGQGTFNDLYSALAFRPRSWLTLESQTRYDINNSRLNFAYHQLTFTPNEWWSWGLGHVYSRAGFVDSGDNLIRSTMFFRVNDNWGFRATHDFNAMDGRLQDQFYTVYRDLRNWTGALTFRVTNNGTGQEDFTVAFSCSIKAHPRHRLGGDIVEPYHLVGE
jgi:lipopolysaccharide assembly outer membrane protein LptD (OstA)